MSKNGVIIKGIGGQYCVLSGVEQHVCLARGRFRVDGVIPIVGDDVVFEPGTGNGHGYILEILPRRNALKRPAVANIDRLVVVLSAGSPPPDLMLCDRLLVHAQAALVEPVVCVNKIDKVSPERVEELCEQYRAVCSVIAVSAIAGTGIEQLERYLAQGITCFAGQSGVGKSSLLNALLPEAMLETSHISNKIQRGRHTTRSVSLLVFQGSGFVADTPGFSVLDWDLLEPERLQSYYPDFVNYRDQCRFQGCKHHREPGCAVREAIDGGQIHPLRWERYVKLLYEVEERWKRRYD